jgi:hypothetical protein
MFRNPISPSDVASVRWEEDAGVMAIVGTRFEDLELAGYTNINSICRQVDRLHGSETLCGDWNGTTLVVGQDFANTAYVFSQLKAGSENPFHHGQILTNRNLCEFLHPWHVVGMDGTRSASCGVLFANAIWLLKNGDGLSARLPNLALAIEVNRPVLAATIENMPKLKTVLCLGKVAYRAVLRYYELKGTWRQDLDSGQPKVAATGVRIWAMSHPGLLGIRGRAKNRSFAECRRMVEEDFVRALGSA